MFKHLGPVASLQETWGSNTYKRRSYTLSLNIFWTFFCWLNCTKKKEKESENGQLKKFVEFHSCE